MRLTITVNGEHREVDGGWEGESLLYALREHLGLPGSKNACEQGECGSCSEDNLIGVSTPKRCSSTISFARLLLFLIASILANSGWSGFKPSELM